MGCFVKKITIPQKIKKRENIIDFSKTRLSDIISFNQISPKNWIFFKIVILFFIS